VVFGYTWGDFSTEFLRLEPIDVILGADCFFDNSAVFDDIFASVVYLFRKNPDAVFLTTYQVRSTNRNIAYLLEKWDLQAEAILLSSFLPPEKADQINQEIELISISKKKATL